MYFFQIVSIVSVKILKNQGPCENQANIKFRIIKLAMNIKKVHLYLYTKLDLKHDLKCTL